MEKKQPAKKAVTTKKEAIKKQIETPQQKVKVVSHINKNVQISPRKLRAMIDKIKGLKPQEAAIRLKFTNNKSARILVSDLQNTIANALNSNLDPDSLSFDTIKADESIKLKRMDKSHSSRFNRGLIQKRHSRIEIKIKGKEK